MLEDAALEKLVHDLLDHSNYFEDKWLLTGVAADCRQAAHELRNLRAKLRLAEATHVTNIVNCVRTP